MADAEGEALCEDSVGGCGGGGGGGGLLCVSVGRKWWKGYRRRKAKRTRVGAVAAMAAVAALAGAVPMNSVGRVAV